MSTPTLTGHTENRIVMLLSSILLLLLLLTGALATGGALAWREYSRAQAALAPARNLEEAAVASRQVAQELTQRQAIFSAFLKQRAEQANKDLKDLRTRRDALGEIPKGPLQKTDFALQFVQLMSDQVFLAQRQLIELELGAARAMRPLPAVEEHLGTGGGAPLSKD